MSYTFQEPDEAPMMVDSDGSESEAYYLMYSITQKRRNKKCLSQMMSNWKDVYNTLDNMRKNELSIEQSNFFMTKIHKLYFQFYRLKRTFYNENIPKTKKKLNKLRNRILN